MMIGEPLANCINVRYWHKADIGLLIDELPAKEEVGPQFTARMRNKKEHSAQLTLRRIIVAAIPRRPGRNLYFVAGPAPYRWSRQQHRMVRSR
jgi:hypothetical protein